ncbi:MAG: hypothetical protein IT376_00040 [Polyangiaceae bacterium]|nr:hypothetical protein [Polyangiaceae bacterium]
MTDWNVLPHAPLEPIGEELWQVVGDLPDMPLKRIMTIARLRDGRLVVHNAIALEPVEMARLEALGEPAILVVPNGWHRLDAPRFAARYPKLRVLCPAGARRKVEKVVTVAGDYADFPGGERVRLERLRGVRDAEGAMIVEGEDGVTAVLNDVVFNMPHVAGSQGFVLRHLTASSGGPRISRVARWLLIADRREVRGELERLAALPRLRQVVVSHHERITEDPAGVLRQVAATLG